jgi:hypothetical protein
MSLGLFSIRMAHATSIARLRATASQLVADRIEAVKSAPRYVAIESLFVATEGTVTGYPGFTRQTMSQHVGGGIADSIDYRIVTVQVTHPQITAFRKTTVIAPF